jgi:hypothetical protein
MKHEEGGRRVEGGFRDVSFAGGGRGNLYARNGGGKRKK